MVSWYIEGVGASLIEGFHFGMWLDVLEVIKKAKCVSLMFSVKRN